MTDRARWAHIVLFIILDVFIFHQVSTALVKYVFLDFKICTRQYFKDFKDHL